MDRQELSYKLSYQLINIVKKQYLIDRYGISTCSDELADGDLYDTYHMKSLVESNFDCKTLIKTE